MMNRAGPDRDQSLGRRGDSDGQPMEDFARSRGPAEPDWSILPSYGPGSIATDLRAYYMRHCVCHQLRQTCNLTKSMYGHG